MFHWIDMHKCEDNINIPDINDNYKRALKKRIARLQILTKKIHRPKFSREEIKRSEAPKGE